MNTDLSISRRSFVIGAGLLTSAALVTPRQVLGRSRLGVDEGVVALMRRQASTAKIVVQPLRGNLSVLMGAGGNIVVLTGPDGKVLVDAGISTAKPQVAAALASLSNDPIRHLINTHWHFDHTDGNEWLHAEGAVIVGHRNCRRRLAEDTRVDGWQFTFKASPDAALPAFEFQKALTLHLNGTTLGLDAFAPAHTDSDIAVEFKELDAIHIGDVWWHGHYPFIDYSTGGSIDGTIRAVETVLMRVSPTTLIIPGHGPVGRRDELADFREMLTMVRQRVAAMKQRGLSLAEVVAAKPTSDFDAQYGHFLTAPAVFTGLVYAGV